MCQAGKACKDKARIIFEIFSVFEVMNLRATAGQTSTTSWQDVQHGTFLSTRHETRLVAAADHDRAHQTIGRKYRSKAPSQQAGEWGQPSKEGPQPGADQLENGADDYEPTSRRMALSRPAGE